MLGDLVVDGDDDLALVRRLVRPLHVLDLQGVGGTGSVVTHTEKKINHICYFAFLLSEVSFKISRLKPSFIATSKIKIYHII